MSFSVIWGELCIQGKKGVIESVKVHKNLYLDHISLFLETLFSQVNALLTCRAEIWGLDKKNPEENISHFCNEIFHRCNLSFFTCCMAK